MGEGQQEALLVSGGDLLRDSRRCRAGGITTMQVFLTKEASAPSVALHALPRCPTDLGSSTLEPPIPVGPLRPSATDDGRCQYGRYRQQPPMSNSSVRAARWHAEAVAGEGLAK